MEIFSHTYATTYGRPYAVTDEEYLQQSLEPPNRLTTRELNQLRAIREEIESRHKLTRFEARYIKVLKNAEKELRANVSIKNDSISRIRELLKETERSTIQEKRSIAIAFLVIAVVQKT